MPYQRAVLPRCGPRSTNSSSSYFADVAIGLATLYNNGTVLVVGANVGSNSNDPSFTKLISHDMRHLHKVFIEPVPWLYRKLRANLKPTIRRYGPQQIHTLQLVVSNHSGNIPIYCFGSVDPLRGRPAVWPAALRRASRWRSVEREGRDWWTQICSLSRERFFASEDLRRDFPFSVVKRQQLFERFVTNTTVRSVTVAELLMLLATEFELPSVRHVQIDVEGFDDVVLRQLPVGRASPLGVFSPASIIFEHMLLPHDRLLSAVRWLQALGYATCVEGQNVVAIAVPERNR